jgi:hypothetical protein
MGFNRTIIGLKYNQKETLRFSKRFLSFVKADKNNNPSLKSCLLRIPGSINSKYNTEVKIIQKWNGHKPHIRLIIRGFSCLFNR